MNDIVLSRTEFDRFLNGLYERDDRLELLPEGQSPAPEEAVDAWTFSAHVDALRSDEIEGDVWGTLDDLEMTADDEESGWEKIKAFYSERGCVLLRVENDEFILGEELAKRLKLY